MWIYNQKMGYTLLFIKIFLNPVQKEHLKLTYFY